MIKKYNQYIKESLLNKLKGPSEEELWNNLLNKYNNYEDIIFAAARANYVEGVKKSLEIINKEGNSGLNFPNLLLNDTIANGSIDVLKYLIEEEGASIDGYYGYNLENAASNNEPEIIKYLLSKGADVNINKRGPLWRAMSKGYVECAKELLKGGAKLEPYMVGVVDKKNKPMLDLLKNYVVVESLLDKLEGPSKEEVLNNLNKKLRLKIINAELYIGYLFMYGLEDNVIDFLNTKIDIKIGDNIDFYLKEIIFYSYLHDKKDIRDYIFNHYYINNIILNGVYERIKNARVSFKTSEMFSDAINSISTYLNSNESLLNRLEGPTQQEIIENLKDNPDKLLRYSIDNEYLEGVELALENGANPNVDNYSLFLYNRKDKEKIIDLLFEYSYIPRIENDFIKILFNNIEPLYSNSDDVVKYKNEYGVLFYFTVFGSNNYLEIPHNIYYIFFNVYNKSKQEIYTLFKNYFNLQDFNIHVTNSSSFKIEKLLNDNLKGLNESLLNKLEGPSKDEIFNNLINMVDQYSALIKAITLDQKEAIDYIVKNNTADTKIQGFVEWYEYIKKWFSDKMKLTMVVDNNDNDFKDAPENDRFYVNRFTKKLYLKVTQNIFEEEGSVYLYDNDTFHEKITNHNRISWKDAENILNSLTYYYFNETPYYVTFASLDEDEE